MFGLFNKKNKILAPLSGECVDLINVPDDAFSQKLLGEGVSIIPSDGKLVAPFDCSVEQIFDSLHAYALKSNDGLEILIHVGIDTVNLNGQGFDNKVKLNQKLKSGDLISNINIDFIESKGYSLHTPIVIMNHENFKFDFKFGKVIANVTNIIEYKSK